METENKPMISDELLERVRSMSRDGDQDPLIKVDALRVTCWVLEILKTRDEVKQGRKIE